MGKRSCLSFCALCMVLSGLVPNTHAHEALAIAKRDIIFLIDGSQNMGNTQFNAIREFMKRFVIIMPIGPDQVQVGVAQFTNTPRLEMDLNSHSSKDSLFAAVSMMRLRGGTQQVNIGAALEFVRTQMLTVDKGSRMSQGVPQLVIVLSAKRSSDSVAQPAVELHHLGVQTIAAGSKFADERELKQIAFEESLVFMLKDFRILLRNPMLMVSALSTLSRSVITEETTKPTLVIGKRDIIFLIDGSQNMGNTQFNAIREFMKMFVIIMPIGPDQVQVGVAQFTNTPRLEMDLNSHSSKVSLLAAVSRMRLRGGTRQVNIGAALEFVRTQMLSVDKGSRISQGVPQLVLVLSAKKSSDSVAQPAVELHHLGVQTIAAGSKFADERELKQIAFEESLVFMLKDFRILLRNPKLIGSALSTLSRSVITEQPTEPTLVIGKRDIIFLIDGSQNMGNTQFNAIREFMKRFVKIMPIGPDQVQVGVAQFTNTPRLEMDLNSYSSKDSLFAAVSRMRLRGGTQQVNIGAALEFVRTQMLRVDKGSRIRQGVPQLVLILSAKKSSDSVAQPAEELHHLGVQTIAAGSKLAEEWELKQIAFNESLVFMLKDFRILLRKPKLMVSALSTLPGVVITEQPTEPTLVIGKRDIIFLIDGSQNMGNTQFNAIREFMKMFVIFMPIGPDQVQVGVAQFTNTPRLEMDLNSYSSKVSLFAAVSMMRLRGGTQQVNIGAALEFVRTQMLRVDKGSRISQGVPQLVLVLSAKKSSDSVAQPAAELHHLGVLTMAAGSKLADEQELKQIAFEESLVFMLQDFRILLRNPKLIGSALSTLSRSVITEQPTEPSTVLLGKRDIVFLIDGSDSVGTDGIGFIRDFILKVLHHLDIHPDLVRVGVVQYSDRQQTEFSPNSLDNKAAVLSAVKRLRLMGGRTANLAEAIDYVLDNELKPAAGVRPSEASQHLVVLTGGSSPSDVSLYSPLLKVKRVNCIAVGASAADSRQLFQIATSPADVLLVPSFSELLGMKEKFIARLSGTTLEVDTPDIQDIGAKPKVADIVFLVDGSINLGRENFKDVMEFIQTIVDLFYTERDNLQIGLAHYAADVTDSFFLNTYKNKDDILDAITRTEYKGGRRLNTEAAIKHVQENHFIKAKGSRIDDGVPQMLMLIKGGRSEDDSKTAALALKNSGVRVYAIGVGDFEDDLYNLGSDQTTVYKARNFAELSELNEQILFTLDDDIRGSKHSGDGTHSGQQGGGAGGP
ncbi:hypothetical protein GJAV_G00209900 [Gymnothorax javanicus]|nr:hypothetical protein GJAV_G00209900 [Gymnothorax javanicus]